jgi:aryl carrier-like protein
MTVLERARDADGSLVVAEVDWEQAVAAAPRERTRSLLRDVAGAGPGPDPDLGPETDTDGGALLRRLRAAPGADQLRILLDAVCSQAAVVLGLPSAEDVDAERSLLELGLSSFTALELSTRLRTTGLDLPPVAIYDHPNALSLARYLQDQLAP